jgi:hypothetical protein
MGGRDTKIKKTADGVLHDTVHRLYQGVRDSKCHLV